MGAARLLKFVRYRIIYALAALLLLPGVSVMATGTEVHPVRAELLADAVRVDPGRAFTLVLQLEIEPGWHVYWRNPGDAGLATAAALELPSGLQAGPWQWPVPSRFVEPGDIVAFGYSGKLLLAAAVTPSSGLGDGSGRVDPARIGVLASWLACKSRCVLGEARLAIDLPVGPELAARAVRLASELSRSVPLQTLDEQVTMSTVLGGLEQGQSSGTISVWLQWKRAPGEVEQFPFADELLDVRDATTRTRGLLTRLDATVQLQGSQRPELFETVVVVIRDGRRTGFRLAVPLDPDQRRGGDDG